MKVPRWVPQSGRPWNPSFGDIWDHMTPDERRMDFIINIGVGAACLVVIAVGVFL